MSRPRITLSRMLALAWLLVACNGANVPPARNDPSPPVSLATVPDAATAPSPVDASVADTSASDDR